MNLPASEWLSGIRNQIVSGTRWPGSEPDPRQRMYRLSTHGVSIIPK